MDRGRDHNPKRRTRRVEPEPFDEYEYEEEEFIPQRRASPPRPRPRSSQRPSAQRKGGGTWRTLLFGCLLGIFTVIGGIALVVFLLLRSSQNAIPIPGNNIISGSQQFKKEETVQVALSSITAIQICDKIGNVAIKVDPNAKTTTVKTTKIVHKNNQAAADEEFGRIVVEVQPPGSITQPLTCLPLSQGTPAPAETPIPPGEVPVDPGTTLTVNVTIPDSDTLLRTTSNAVDIAITIPKAVLPVDVAAMLLNVEAPVGNISVDGLSGVLHINGSTGNVDVKHAVLVAGSRIETAQGNVTFDGWLLPPSENMPPRYNFHSEKGNINVTLPASTNITLDANTNVGAVNSEFAIEVENNGGPVNYYGPLNPEAGPPSATKLTLNVSTGDVNIHKAQDLTS